MNLYLMRHGEARQDERDFDRKLTRAGEEDVKAGARTLADEHIARVISSPLARARQTAALVIEALALPGNLEVWDELVPGGDPAAVANKLVALGDADGTLLVGHQPFAGKFIYWLTGEDTGVDTASIACISTDVLAQHCGSLRWITRG